MKLPCFPEQITQGKSQPLGTTNQLRIPVAGCKRLLAGIYPLPAQVPS